MAGRPVNYTSMYNSCEKICPTDQRDWREIRDEVFSRSRLARGSKSGRVSLSCCRTRSRLRIKSDRTGVTTATARKKL